MSNDDLIRQHGMSRPWSHFLFGTLPVFGCVGALLVTPFIFAHYLMGPKIAATWATVNSEPVPVVHEIQWANWLIIFVLLIVGTFMMMLALHVVRVAESGIETVDGEVVDEPQDRRLLKSGK